MRRRDYITFTGIAATGGCLRLQDRQTSEGNTNNETANRSKSAEAANRSSNTEAEKAEESSDTVEINNIDTINTVEQGSQFEVKTTVTADTSTKVLVEIIDKSGEPIGEKSTIINQTGKKTVSLSFIPSSTSATGNGSVRVQAIKGSVNKKSTKTIQIIDPVEDWEESLSEAKSNIEQFLNKYASVDSKSDNQTILDVTISDRYQFNGQGNLYSAEENAREAIEEAETPEETNQIRKVIDEVEFLLELSSLQTKHCDIWPLLRTELKNFRNESNRSGDINPKFKEVSKKYNNVSKLLDKSSIVVGSNYEQKLTQINAELDIVDSMITGITLLYSGEALSARREFDLIIRNIEDKTSYPPKDDVDEEFRDLVQKWEAEADD